LKTLSEELLFAVKIVFVQFTSNGSQIIEARDLFLKSD